MRQDPEAHRTRRRSGCARKRITRRLLVARLRVKIADWRRNRASRPVWSADTDCPGNARCRRRRPMLRHHC